MTTPATHSLYQLEVGGTYRSRFAYASGYTPLPDRKSFVPPAMQKRNHKFIELNGFNPGIQISNEGSKWPDFLANGCGYVSFFVSERVVTDLRDAKIEFLDITEFPIESVGSGCRTKLRIEDAPRYFVLEAHPELVPDWAAMNVPLTPDGKPILNPRPKGWPPTIFIYRKDTWSGRDLVSYDRDTTCVFCSERFREFAKRRKWTNLEFQRTGWHTLRDGGKIDLSPL